MTDLTDATYTPDQLSALRYYAEVEAHHPHEAHIDYWAERLLEDGARNWFPERGREGEAETAMVLHETNAADTLAENGLTLAEAEAYIRNRS